MPGIEQVQGVLPPFLTSRQPRRLHIQGVSKKGCLVKLDFWGLSKRPYTQQYKSIIFYPKLWYPEAWFPMVYSISLLGCMVKYKDASKDQSNLIPLNTLFLDALYGIQKL